MQVYDITKYGAKSDGSLCTQAIQTAIDNCSKTGGTVEIPEGTYVTGSLRLRSNITVRLCKNAVLKGSGNQEDYQSTHHIHNEMGEVFCLIYAEDCEDISFEGDGCIDFNGRAFFDMTRPHNDWVDLSSYTEKQLQQFEVYASWRPNQSIFFVNCKDISMRDIHFTEAPCWGLGFSACDDIQLTNLTIRFSHRYPNDDGIHLSSCHNVIITGCDIVSGDDCIAVSGINDWTRESKNIVISNCLLSSASSAIRLGHWNSKVQDVIISNCIIYETNRGICSMTCGGGYLRNINISGMNIHTRSISGTWWGRGEAISFLGVPFEFSNHPGTELNENQETINFDNITFRDININSEQGIILLGENHNMQNLKFYNCDITIHNSENRALHGHQLDAKPSQEQYPLPEDTSYWLYAGQVDRLRITDADIHSELSGNVCKLEQKTDGCSNMALTGISND